MEYVKGDFDTKFGMMQFALTEANHVHVSAGSGSDPLPGLEVNGVLYYVSAHVYRKPDGMWAIKEDDYREPYMSRKEGMGDATPSARKKAGAAIGEAFTAFISPRPLWPAHPVPGIPGR